MIRGAIDYADQQRVAGWIYSDVASVSGHTVLAFLDKDCVGAGALDVFRQDLADAGLGDGMVGFNFGVGTSDEDLGRVTVRLEGSDFCLIQPQARISSDGNLIERLKAQKRLTAADIDWMRDRGWIDGADHELLGTLTEVGLYDRALNGRTGKTSAEAEAKRCLELYAQGPLAVVAEAMMPAEFAERRLALLAELALPIVAVHAEAGMIAVLEGSNGDEDFYREKDMLGSVQHRCGAGQLLFLDLRAQFRGIGDRPITVFLAR